MSTDLPPEKLRMLQVEDSESDAALVTRVLEKSGFSVYCERVDDAPQLRAALGAGGWDVIIADYHLPRFDAPEALRILHESGQDIPFVIVSGAVGEALAVEMMRSGAHDYLMKDNLARLAPAVRREIREARARRERKREQEALRESQERLELAITATQLGWFDVWPQTGHVIWSELNRRHFGLSPDAEVTIQTFQDGIHRDDRNRVLALIAGLFRGENNGQYAAEYRTVGIEDGVERWLTARGRVFFDSEGQPFRFVGVTLDITEHKQLEEQFLQAQKLESIGRLAGGVAHDFNNLLTIITGYAHVLSGQVPPQHPFRDPLGEISKAAMRATELTRQLLAFSRQQASAARNIGLNDIVLNFEKMLRRLIGEDVELLLSLDSGTGALHADPGQVEQVLMNLAVNARDAMPTGGKLLIETSNFTVDERFAQRRPTVALGNYVLLTVTDTGGGMSAEVKRKAFDPFFTTKERGKGTGLGLSTVHGIVSQHGGAIWIYSEAGRGCSFKVLFPRVESATTPAAAVEEAPAPLGKETILVVEDEIGVRSYVCEILELHGYTVLEAATGRQAVQVSERHRAPIHLLLTDAVMPEMGGHELAEQFATARPETQVLFMSGYSERLRTADSVTNFIQKPFTPAALLMQVRTLLDGRSAGAPSD